VITFDSFQVVSTRFFLQRVKHFQKFPELLIAVNMKTFDRRKAESSQPEAIAETKLEYINFSFNSFFCGVAVSPSSIKHLRRFIKIMMHADQEES
jgi:hypothetical protein